MVGNIWWGQVKAFVTGFLLWCFCWLLVNWQNFHTASLKILLLASTVSLPCTALGNIKLMSLLNYLKTHLLCPSLENYSCFQIWWELLLYLRRLQHLKTNMPIVAQNMQEAIYHRWLLALTLHTKSLQRVAWSLSYSG